jgi:hypothetical protein
VPVVVVAAVFDELDPALVRNREALDRERFEPDGVRGSLHRLLVLELVLDDHAVDLPVAQARIVFDELDRFEDVEASLADRSQKSRASSGLRIGSPPRSSCWNAS